MAFNYGKIIQYYADIPYGSGDVITYAIVSRNFFGKLRASQPMLVHGWENNRRVHSCIVHAEIRNNKIWIHYDGIEDSITNELVAAGVPKDCIVLAFNTPEIREHTGYAIA